MAVFLPNDANASVALFGISTAGGVFVPINPLFKPAQVAHILRNCAVNFLVTSVARARQLAPLLDTCADLHTVIATEAQADNINDLWRGRCVSWETFMRIDSARASHRNIDSDVATITVEPFAKLYPIDGSSTIDNTDERGAALAAIPTSGSYANRVACTATTCLSYRKQTLKPTCTRSGSWSNSLSPNRTRPLLSCRTPWWRCSSGQTEQGNFVGHREHKQVVYAGHQGPGSNQQPPNALSVR